MPRSESGIGSVPGISVSALECIDFGLCFLGVVQKDCAGGNGTVPKGVRKGGRQFCCRWLFCILIACRAEKYATKLTLACNLLPPPHPQLLLSLSVCDLHFAAGQRHSKFASNFVCLLPPEPAANASSITARTHSRLSLQFAQITQPAPPPTPRFPSAFIIKCLRRLMELPKLKHLAHT